MPLVTSMFSIPKGPHSSWSKLLSLAQKPWMRAGRQHERLSFPLGRTQTCPVDLRKNSAWLEVGLSYHWAFLTGVLASCPSPSRTAANCCLGRFSMTGGDSGNAMYTVSTILYQQCSSVLRLPRSAICVAYKYVEHTPTRRKAPSPSPDQLK